MFPCRKLETQLDQFGKIAKEQSQSEERSDESGIVYHINYRPELAKLKQTSRVAQLEARIHHLERVLGASDEKLNRLAAGSSKGIIFLFFIPFKNFHDWLIDITKLLFNSSYVQCQYKLWVKNKHVFWTTSPQKMSLYFLIDFGWLAYQKQKTKQCFKLWMHGMGYHQMNISKMALLVHIWKKVASRFRETRDAQFWQKWVKSFKSA